MTTALSEVPTVDEIIATFRNDDVDARRHMIQRCPAGKFTDMAQMIAGMSTPGANVQSLQSMTQSYAFDGPQEFGVAFGEACFRLARELYEGPESNVLHLLCAGNGSVSWLTSLSQLGRHAEARERALEVIAWLEDHGDTQNIDSVRLRLVDAHVSLDDLDSARALLDSMDESKLPPFVAINFRTYRDRIGARIRDATDLPDDHVPSFEERLKKIISGVPGKPGRSNEELLDGLVSASGKIMEILGGPDKDNELAVDHRITEAAQLFRDPVAGRDPKRIAEVEKVLVAGRDWMRRHGSQEGEASASWPLYLCYSRTGRDELALEALRTVRTYVEAARARIANPIERAGITNRYPVLYPCLVMYLHKLGRPAELVQAIEASKGRALADVLAQRGGEVVGDATFATAAQNVAVALPKPSASATTHYLTYFVDDDCTYAALLRRGGDPQIDKIPIKRKDLADLAAEIRTMAATSGPAAKRLPADLGARLAPLVAILDGRVSPDDHVCYSPDDAIHLLPLQAATLRGKPLVRHVSVSKTHGAQVLLQALSRTPSMKRAVVIEVPSAEDAADPRRVQALERAGSWLRRNMKDAQTCTGVAATVDAIAALSPRQSIVHFATHGVFPPPTATGDAANPYVSSGLLLAASGKLPDFRKKISAHLLSPRRMVEKGVALDGSHVTLQACVSGLSREGVAGDALGLEFALFQLGASSVLSTHWTVSAQTSGAFAAAFYDYVLTKGLSRATACRRTVLDFLNGPDELAQPFHWSAFSLSGDFR